MTRVLILGSTGNMGHQVYYRLKMSADLQLYDVSFRRKLTAATHLLDVTDVVTLEEHIKTIRPHYIVNCIGVLRKGSDNIANAIFINAYLPHRLAALAYEYDSKLIHMSTDCVFSGNKGGYLETDLKDGVGIYSETKSLGEVIDDRNLTLRTSIVGPEIKAGGEGLFHWFMSRDGDIQGYTEAIWSGVSTLELARAVEWGITSNTTGLYHVTNNTSISKYHLLELFKKYTKKKIEIQPVPGYSSNKSFRDTRGEIEYRIPGYNQMIEEMIADIRLNAARYSYSQDAL